MSRSFARKHRPRCRLCHPGKLEGNSMKNANRTKRVARIKKEEAADAR